MYNRIVILMILMLTLGLSICNAESWQRVDSKSWVDTDSIQIENNGIIKVTIREYLKDNNYYIISMIIDKSNKKFCNVSIELHNIDGRSLGKSSLNPADKEAWVNYFNDNKVINAIIERTAAR